MHGPRRQNGRRLIQLEFLFSPQEVDPAGQVYTVDLDVDQVAIAYTADRATSQRLWPDMADTGAG